MKIFPKQTKTDRESSDFYFGNYGEIPIGISSATILDVGTSNDLLHYHKKSHEFYLTIKGAGILEIEGVEYMLDENHLLMVEPGEKHKVKAATKTPFSFIAITTVKNKDDKVVLE